MTYRELDKDAKIRALEERNQELEKENQLLLKIFADSVVAKAMKENPKFFKSVKQKKEDTRRTREAAKALGLTLKQYRNLVGAKSL